MNTEPPEQPQEAAEPANPLLQPSPLPYGLPPFNEIRNRHFMPAFEAGMTEQRGAVQAIANLLDSPGALAEYGVPPRPREIIATAKRQSVGVMGIRAVQAGALTKAFDRPLSPGDKDAADFELAAPFRQLCAKWGADPAITIGAILGGAVFGEQGPAQAAGQIDRCVADQC